MGVASWQDDHLEGPADGKTSIPYVLTALDATAAPWRYVALVLQASDASVRIGQPTRTTAEGLSEGSVVCTQAGRFTLSAAVQAGQGTPTTLSGEQLLVCTPAAVGGQTPPPAAAAVAITADHPLGIADLGTPTLVTLVVTDADGRPLSNQTIFLSTERAGDAVVPTTATTDAQGRVQVALTAQSLGAATITARVGAISASTTVQFVASAPAAAASLFVVRPGAVTADGVVPLYFDLAVKDSSGHGVPYAQVTLTSDTAGDVLWPQKGITDGAGVLQVVLTGTRAGERTVTANLYGASLTAVGVLNPGPPSGLCSSLKLTPDATTADGVSPSYVAIALKDAFCNVVPQAPLALVSSNSTDTIDGLEAVTGDDGTALAQVVGTQAGPRTLSLSSNGVVSQAGLTLFAGAPSTALSSLTISPAAVVAGAPATVQLRLVDGRSNGVASSSVRFISSDSGDVLTPNQGATDAAGLMTAQFVGTTQGSHTVIASLGGAGTSVAVPVVVQAAAVDVLHSSLYAASNTAQADNQAAIAVAVVLRDRFNNPVASAPIALRTTGSAVTLTPASGVTDSAGQFASALKSGVAQGLQLIASSSGQDLPPLVLQLVSGPSALAASTFTSAPAAAVADGIAALSLVVAMKDALGNPVAGLPVALSIGPPAQGTLLPTSGSTDGQGLWTSALKSTQAGSKTLTARSGTVVQTQVASFVAGPPALGQSTLSAAPSAVVADGQSQATVLGTLRDAFGNAVGNLPVTWGFEGVPGSIGGASVQSSPTGVAMAQLSGTVAGAGNVTLQAGSVVLRQNITLLPGVASSACSTVTLSPNQQVADGSPLTITVRLRDAQNNAIADGPIRLSADLGSIAGASAQTTTDATGAAGAAWSSTTAGTAHLTVQSGNTTLMAQAAFVAGAPSAATSTLVLSGGPSVADGTQTIAGLVTLRDAFNNPVPLSPITWASSKATDVWTPLSGLTDASGRFSAAVAATAAGDRTLTVHSGLTTLSAAATFAPGAPDGAHSVLSLSSNAIVANGAVPATLRWSLADAFGNPTPGQPVTFVAGSPNVVVGPSSTVSDAQGMASAVVLSSTAGSVVLHATAGAAQGNITLLLLPGPPDPAHSSFWAGPSAVADGNAQVALTLALKDTFDNPTPGVAVALALRGSATLRTPSALTDVDGLLSTSVTSLVAHQVQVLADTGRGALATTATFVPGPAAAVQSALFVNPGVIAADGSTMAVLRVVAEDVRGNVVPVLPVHFSSSDSNDVLTADTFTNAAGLAVGSMTSTSVGNKVLTASLGGGLVLSGNVTVAPSGATPQTLSLVANTNVLPADGHSQVMLTLMASDTMGQPLSGHTATLSVNNAGARLSPTSLTLDSSGSGSAVLTSEQVANLGVQATVDGATAGTLIQAVAGSPNQALSSLQVTPAQATANGSDQALITVTLLDDLRHPIGDAPVTFVSDSNVTLQASSGLTSSSGIASIRATSTLAKPYAVTASAGGITLHAMAAFVAAPADAGSSFLVLSPNQAVADGSAALTAQLLLADRHGNPLSNAPIALSSTLPALSIVPSSPLTDSAGRATAQLRSVVAGPFSLTAQASGLRLVTQGRFVAGSPNQQLSSLVVAPTAAPADGQTSVNATAQLRDDHNNPVPQASVTFSASGPGVQVTTPVVSSGADGMAATALRATVSGGTTVRAQTGATTLTAPLQWLAGSPNAALSTLMSAPSAAAANGSDAIALTAYIRDTFGNLVANQAVSLSASSPTVSLVSAPTTDGNGVWRGAATSTLAQEQGITLTAGAMHLAGSVRFLAGIPDAGHSTVAPSAANTVANGQSSVNILVAVADARGNPVSHQNVTLSIGGVGNSAGPLTGSTDADGQWQTTLTSTTAETKPLAVQIAGQTLVGQVAFVAGAPSSDTSTIVATPNSLVADGSKSAGIVIAVRDAFGNPVAHTSVSIVPLPAGCALQASSGTTDSAGQFVTSLTSTLAGSPTLTAVFSEASATGQVTFLPGPPSAATSTLTPSSLSFAADGQSRLFVYLQLADAFSNPIAGAVVTLTSSVGSDTVAPLSGATSALGGLGFSVVAQDTGTHTLKATSAGMQLTAQVTAGPGLPDATASKFTFNPAAVTADGVSVAVLSVMAYDRLGHVVPNQSVSLSGTGSHNQFIPGAGLTDANGAFRSTLSSTLAESKNITAVLGTTSISSAVIFKAGPMDGNSSMLVASPSVVNADGVAGSVLTLVAQDAQKNAIPNRAVEFSVGGVGGTLRPVSAVTDAFGRAQTVLSSSAAEDKTVVARADNTGVNARVRFTPVTANTPAYTLSVSPNSLVADGTQATVTLALKDSDGNPMAGQPATVQAADGLLSVAAPSGTTDAQGLFTTTLSSFKAGIRTITASAGGIKQSAQVRFVPGSPVAAQSDFTSSPNSVVADGLGVAQLRLTLRDAYGNSTPNIAVGFSGSGSGSTLVPTSTSTDATGTAYAALSATAAEHKTITATFGGTSLASSVQFVAGPVSSQHATLLANPNSIAADGVSQSTVVVILTDAFGNPVGQVPLTFAASGSSSTLMPTQTVSDAAGRASVTLTGTQAGIKVLTATAPNTTVSGPISFTPGPPSNARSSFAISPNVIVANNSASATLRVVVRDAYDNLLTQSPVSFTASGSGTSFSSVAGLTNAQGAFVSQMKGSLSELKTITAVLDGTSLSGQALLVPGPVNPNQSSLTALPPQAVADGQSAITLKLTLKDAFGNLISQAPVSFSSSNARAIFDLPQAATDANAQVAVSIVSTKAQPTLITASAGGSAINTGVQFIPGGLTARSISVVAQPGYQVADANAPITITFFAADAGGNPIGQLPLRLTSSNALDVLSLPNPVQTGNDGRLVGLLTATQAGSRIIVADANGIMSSTSVVIGPAATDVSRSTAAISPNTVVADTMSQGSLVLTVRDTYGNAVPNQAVGISIIQGDHARTALSPATGYSDASGVFVSTVTASLAENKQLRSSFGSVYLDTQVAFVPGPTSPVLSSVACLPSYVGVDTAQATTITVSLKDAQGNAKPFEPISLTASGSNNQLTPQSGSTDANGVFAATLTSTRAETKSIIATTSITSVDGTVTFGPGSPNSALSTLMAAPTPLVADNATQTTLTAAIRDRFGNSVPGAPLTFSGGGAVVFTPPTATTDGAGMAFTQAKSSLAQNVTLAASTGLATVYAQVVWTAGAAAAGHADLILSPNTIVVDGASSVLARAVFRDIFDNPVTGQTVVLSVPSPYGAAQPTSPSDANGSVTGSIFGVLAGATSVTASMGGVGVSAPLVLLPGSPNALRSSLTLSPNVQVADGSSVMVVQATFRDAFNNSIFGKNVTFGGIGAHDTLGAPYAVTSSLGKASTTLVSTLAQNIAPTAQMGNVVVTAPGRFVAGSPNMAMSSVAISPNTLVANGSSQVTLQVTARDVYANPVPNLIVALGASGTANALPATITTSASGIATAAWTSTKAEQKQVTATATGLSFAQNVTFLPGSPNAVQSQLVASPNVQVADGYKAVALTATMKDAFGNITPNINLTFSAQGANTIITPVSVGTDAAGRAAVTATSNMVGIEHFVASSSSASIATDVNFTLGAPAYVYTTINASPNDNMAINGNVKSQYTLTVRDSLNRALPNQNVKFYGTDAATLFSSRAVSTDAYGVAAAAMTSLTAGPRIGFAKVGNVTLGANANFVANTASVSEAWFGVRPSALTLPGNGVHTIATDMTNDGNIDIVVATAGAAAVSLFVNQGSGVFASPVSYAASGVPQHMVAVDLNGDSYKDIVLATNGNSITTFLNGRNATLNSGISFGVNGNVIGLCSADINGDGYADVLALSTRSPAGVNVLLGNGSGSYTRSNFVDMGAARPIRCAMADFDQDGKTDFAVTDADGNALLVYRGSGNGNFTQLASYPTLRSPEKVIAGAFTSNGYPGLLVTSPLDAAINVFMGAANGNFSNNYALGCPNMANSLALVDLNGDGAMDLVALQGGGSSWSLISVWTNNSGGFYNRQDATIRIRSNNVALADIDGDGRLDYIVSASQAPVTTVLYGGDSNTPPSQNQPGVLGSSNIALGKFSSDGNYNLLSKEIGFVRIYSDIDKPTFQRSLVGDYHPTGPIFVGDFNGDGKADFGTMYNFFTNTADIYLGDGNRQFSGAKTVQPFALNQGSVDSYMCVGDLNGDNVDDVVFIGNTSKVLSVAIANRAASVFDFSTINFPSGQSACRQCVIADVNQDGNPDVLIPCSKLLVYLGAGDGSLAAPTAYTPNGISEQLADLAVGDVDGNGLSDVLVDTATSGTLLWFANSSNGLQPSVTIAHPQNRKNFRVQVGDFNGDGRLDIATGRPGSISLYYNDGSGNFPKVRDFAAGAVNDLIVVDMNKDGLSDIIASTSDVGPTLWYTRPSGS